MTEKELKQLSRRELLDLLGQYSRGNAELQLKLEKKEEELRQQQIRFEKELEEEHKNLQMQEETIKKLEAEKETLTATIEKRDLHLQDVGNIAEATLKISGFFEEAQKTAEMYVANVKQMVEQQEAEMRSREARSLEDLQRLGDEASKLCIVMREQTEKDCSKLREETKTSCQKRRMETETYCSQLKESTEKYCSQLKESTENYCKDLRSRTEAESKQQEEPVVNQTDIAWDDLSSRMEAFYQAHQGMKELFGESGMKMPTFMESGMKMPAFTESSMKMPTFMETSLEEEINNNRRSFVEEIDAI